VHELAVCQGLIGQVARVAREQRASQVHAVTVAVGALSGVESGLLERAFTIARAGTVADQAQLHVETLPARIACGECAAEADVPANRLLCPRCANWRVRVVGGEELVLTHVELTRVAEATQPLTMAG
jgi:hydrogenase nickel incorporation protein HypA/HybF